MKKRIIPIFMLAGLLLAWSCKDKFLETLPQDGTITDATAFRSTADFDAYLFGAYTEMQQGSGKSWINLPSYISQDIAGDEERPMPLGSYLTPGNEDVVDYWVNLYKLVGRANLVLDKLLAAGNSISVEDRTRIEGEAKFIRGFAYFMLGRAYGNIPMPLKSYDPSQNNMECTPEAQVWDQVVTDLTTAAAQLPESKDWGTDNLGRASKGAALAYLANAYMYKKDWNNALQASQDLENLTKPKYRLLKDLRQVYSQQNENNDESIFEIQFRDVDNGSYNWSGQPNNGHLLNETTAPRNIGDDYAPFGGWGGLNLTRKFANSFEPGDERRTKMIVTVGETYQGELMKDAVTVPADIPQPNLAFSTKYWLGPAENYLGGQNLPQMRFAEFLLNYAEILFESGNAANAYARLNEVRRRAGLKDKPVSPDRETFMNDLMYERRAELYLEPNGWFHFTRTGRAAKFFQEEQGSSFNPAWNHLPIPQSDRDQNPRLCQNEGY